MGLVHLLTKSQTFWSLPVLGCLALDAKLPRTVVKPFVSFNVVKPGSLSQFLNLLTGHLWILLECLVQCMFLLIAQSILVFSFLFRFGELDCDLALGLIISAFFICLHFGGGNCRLWTPSRAAKRIFGLLRLDISLSVANVGFEHLAHQQIDSFLEGFSRIHTHFKTI